MAAVPHNSESQAASRQQSVVQATTSLDDHHIKYETNSTMPSIEDHNKVSQTAWASQWATLPTTAPLSFTSLASTSSDQVRKLQCEVASLKQLIITIANLLGVETIEDNDMETVLTAKVHEVYLAKDHANSHAQSLQLELDRLHARVVSAEQREKPTILAASGGTTRRNQQLATVDHCMSMLEQERNAAETTMRTSLHQHHSFVCGAALPDTPATAAVYEMYSRPAYKAVEIRVNGAIIPKGFTVNFAPSPPSVPSNDRVQRLRKMSTLSKDMQVLRPFPWKLSRIDLTGQTLPPKQSAMVTGTEMLASPCLDQEPSVRPHRSVLQFDGSGEPAQAPLDSHEALPAQSATMPKVENDNPGDAISNSELWVGNLAYGTTEMQIGALFAPYNALDWGIIKDMSRHAYVLFASNNAAQAAINGLKGTVLVGRKISFSFVKPSHIVTGGGIRASLKLDKTNAKKRKRD